MHNNRVQQAPSIQSSLRAPNRTLSSFVPPPAAYYPRPCLCICVEDSFGHPLRPLPPAELLCSAHLSLPFVSLWISFHSRRSFIYCLFIQQRSASPVPATASRKLRADSSSIPLDASSLWFSSSPSSAFAFGPALSVSAIFRPLPSCVVCVVCVCVTRSDTFFLSHVTPMQMFSVHPASVHAGI